MLALGPGYGLDLHAAAWALHAAHGIDQYHCIAPDRDKLEAACRELVVARGRALAARASRLRALAGPDIDLDGLGGCVQPRGVIHEPRESVTVIE